MAILCLSVNDRQLKILYVPMKNSTHYISNMCERGTVNSTLFKCQWWYHYPNYMTDCKQTLSILTISVNLLCSKEW